MSDMKPEKSAYEFSVLKEEWGDLMNMKTTEIIEEQKWKKCRLSNRGSDAERNDDSWKDWRVKNELLQKLWKYKKLSFSNEWMCSK